MSPPRRPRFQARSPRRSNLRQTRSWSRRLETGLARLQQLKKRQVIAEHQRRQAFALSLLVCFICILLLALVPGQHRIETQVVVTQLSFETALSKEEPRRRFLDSIRNLEAISLKGLYPESLTLSGTFAGSTIGRQTKLEIELPYDYSQIQFSPLDDATTASTAELELLALQLQDQTNVETLQYAPFSRRLTLDFNHATPPDSVTGSLLEIDFGQQPLQLTIEGYRLPQFGLEDTDGNSPLTLTFIPDIKELGLPLPQQGTLSLSLPPLTNRDTLRWFWGNMPVTQTSFTIEERRDGDVLERSTIRRGKVRLADQSLDIEADQFLLLKKPGIQTLRYLQLIDGEGIEVRARGKTAAAQIGIDTDFPVQGLRSNIIARVFRPDVVIAIISFSGAMVASLLSWLIDNLFKPE